MTSHDPSPLKHNVYLNNAAYSVWNGTDREHIEHTGCIELRLLTRSGFRDMYAGGFLRQRCQSVTRVDYPSSHQGPALSRQITIDRDSNKGYAQLSSDETSLSFMEARFINAAAS